MDNYYQQNQFTAGNANTAAAYFSTPANTHNQTSAGGYSGNEFSNTNYYVTTTQQQPTATYKMFTTQQVSSNLKTVQTMPNQDQYKQNRVYDNFVASGTGASSNQPQSYDTGVYTAYTEAMKQQRTHSGPSGGMRGGYMGRRGGRGGGQGYSHQSVNPDQLIYCDLCKCQCMGRLSYQNHIVGKAHKKREELAKSGVKPENGSNGDESAKSKYFCTLCDVNCSGPDAFQMHLVGQAHSKVMSTFRRMGKEIPADIKGKTETAMAQKDTYVAQGSSGPKSTTGETDSNQLLGEEYLEAVYNSQGRVTMYNCKLCECEFTDVNAKNAHIKGKRHLLSYKKKVDPSLHVQSAPSTARYHAKHNVHHPGGELREDRIRRNESALFTSQYYRNDPYFIPPARRHQDYVIPGRLRKNDAFRLSGVQDRHLRLKHQQIYPPVRMLKIVQDTVSTCERALKMASDLLTLKRRKEDTWVMEFNSAMAKANGDAKTTEKDEKMPTFTATVAELKALTQPLDPSHRQIHGVVRIGDVAKGLLVNHGAIATESTASIELMIMCSQRPSAQLFNEVLNTIPEHLTSDLSASKDPKIIVPTVTYKVEAATDQPYVILVHATAEFEPKDGIEDDQKTKRVTITARLFFTGNSLKASKGSVVTVQLIDKGKANDKTNATKVEDDDEEAESLDPGKLDPFLTLTRVRERLLMVAETRWFQSSLAQYPSALVVIRILRDLCRRVQTWAPFPQAALEYLVDRCMIATKTQGPPPSPMELLRGVFECIAAGLLLSDGPGLRDPTHISAVTGGLKVAEENNTRRDVDAVASLSSQQKEDITASAQHALRLIGFFEIHKVLGMERLEMPTKNANNASEKSTAAPAKPATVKSEADAKMDTTPAPGGTKRHQTSDGESPASKLAKP